MGCSNCSNNGQDTHEEVYENASIKDRVSSKIVI